MSILLDSGADINAADNNGFTACMIASDRGHSSIVFLLLDRGADIHAKNIIDNGLKGFKFDLFIQNQFISYFLNRMGSLPFNPLLSLVLST